MVGIHVLILSIIIDQIMKLNFIEHVPSQVDARNFEYHLGTLVNDALPDGHDDG